jgi:hypothetical protein
LKQITEGAKYKNINVKFEITYISPDIEFLSKVEGAELVFVYYSTADSKSFETIDSTIMTWMISETIPIVLIGTNI